MLTLTIIGIVILLALILGIFYIIGFFSSRVSGQVELIIFALANLNPNSKNARQLPRKLAKLVKVLIHKKKLFLNKIKIRRALKKAKQKNRSKK
ncbi:MAG: hypothetical protein HY931_04690 [Candidatus Falkowbacteria bacterium]|nr:MAG: hypothetical protein HY931_04690 [Candidatus Falkowbacteria bacterium]